jgi:hypothetical protein
LNKETIAEQEAFCRFRDYWQTLSRIQPNLLGKPARKSVKKASKKLDVLDVLDLQLSLGGFRLLSPGWPKTPGNLVSLTKGRALKARKAPVVRKGRKQ